MRTIGDLRQRQALPLHAKVLMSQARIREWYNYFDGDVYVSFSGGKDSTVLAHLVHDMYPNVPLVFSNTGLEFPEIQAFARKMGAEFIYPKMTFSEVVSKYGYPLIGKEVAESISYSRRIRHDGARDKTILTRRPEFFGKRGPYNKDKYLPLLHYTAFKISGYCCNVMKKGPFGIYQRKNKLYPYTGLLAEESKLRRQAWLRHGCNAFESKKKTSQPMSFWTEQDVLRYIAEEGLEIASVYGDIVAVGPDGSEYGPMLAQGCTLKCTGCSRTGCLFCAFGAHLDKGESRFQRLARTHPKQYDYCMKGGAVGGQS